MTHLCPEAGTTPISLILHIFNAQKLIRSPSRQTHVNTLQRNPPVNCTPPHDTKSLPFSGLHKKYYSELVPISSKSHSALILRIMAPTVLKRLLSFR